ncbi:MAG: ATP-dependent zinc metalloprotease FtsH [Oscillospiraceae bacterium]|nr:ATP-dependent zinc metalloprotease FtsH [Oscillospiraceae bacterium]
MLLIYSFVDTTSTSPEYYEVIRKFESKQITKFSLNLGSGKLLYVLSSDDYRGNYTNQYNVPDVGLFLQDVRTLIKEYNEAHPNSPMEYDYVAASNIWSVLLGALPTLLLIGLMVFLYINMSQQGGGRMNAVGKARTKTAQDEGRTATFDDVAGADEEKAELQEIVEYLKRPADFNMLGASIPRGVLLIGPPGTGKTLLARAVAGEAGVPFFSISGSDFVELYVGVGASRVRDLFDKAKRARPSIIFIDEIDAVGRRRGAGLGGGHDEREQTLNQLLVEMDGFSTNEGVIVMAATNRSDILDPALLRPGRFDREIYVGYPDVRGREEILRVHSKGKPLAPDVNLETVAKTTQGFTGADLENLLNEAALLAARHKRKAVTQEDIEEASIKVIAGPEKKSRVVTDNEKKVTAYHEAGHAVARYFAAPDTPVHQVSIIPRGMTGGYTMALPGEDHNYMTRNRMMNEIISALGGRVAERIALDDVSTGASNDLERATSIARAMVTKYGFSDRIGPIVYDSESNQVFLGRDFTQSRNYSEKVASDIDSEVRNIIDNAYEACKKILEDNMEMLNTVADALLEFEKIDGETFKKLMESKTVSNNETPGEKEPPGGEASDSDGKEAQTFSED